jgi:RNA polymerase sigma-70 factor (ECF subfamily)
VQGCNLFNHVPYQDRELLSRIAAGDERAFADFVWKHTDGIYSYILKITKAEHWAEELVQDVWVQVWAARQEFAVLEQPLSYLYRMAQHRSLDWIRRNKRELKAQYLIQQQLQPRAENAVSEKIDYENTRRLLLKAIDELPAQRKRIFELKQSGLSYEEISATLHISKNTVRNQMVSALHSLRTFLQQDGEWLLLLFLKFFF